MADSTFLPEDDFPEDLDPEATLDVLDERLRDPTAAPPDLLVIEPEVAPPGRSWAFDFDSNVFVRRSSGVAVTRGIPTLRQWIVKCLRTDRGAHPIHSDDYGMVRPFDMIGMPLAAISSDDLHQRVEEALVFHPLIAGVQDFQMNYDPMEPVLNVSFTVVLVDEMLLTVALSLP